MSSYDGVEPILTENDIEINEFQYNEFYEKRRNGYKENFEVKDNKVIFTYTLRENWLEIQNKRKINTLRNKRIPLLLAFDKYKSNVNYGIVVEDEETKGRIISWYSDLLNLVESAFEKDNIPSEIKYYL